MDNSNSGVSGKLEELLSLARKIESLTSPSEHSEDSD